MEKNAKKTVEMINSEIAKLNDEISQTENELRELETGGEVTNKQLDARNRLVSRAAMLRSRKAGLESEILPAKRAEAAAKLERLKAEHVAAIERREKVIAECREGIAAWYNYAGGENFLRKALGAALPVREATFAVMELQSQLAGAQAALRNLS